MYISPIDKTPNSFGRSSIMESDVWSSNAIDGPTIKLALFDAKIDDELLRAGDVTVEERLAILGILVGVSFGICDIDPENDVDW